MSHDQDPTHLKKQQALQQALTKLSIPEGYVCKSVRSEKQDNVGIWVFRYEQVNGENTGLGGEHYSFTITQDTHKILGVMWLSQKFLKGMPLPSDEETKAIARTFLQQVEPGLFERSENRWIRPEDFSINVDGKEMTVTGVRYKCYVPEENTWAWVIVAPDGNVMAFEQDMLWKGARLSEMWLHDHWLLKGANGNKLTSYIKSIARKL